MKTKVPTWLPNSITCLRILGALALLFIEPLTAVFYWVYTFAGLSDALDGWLARRTHTTSELGKKLDSVADLLFYSVMLVRLLPVLLQRLPLEIWILIGVILLVRICAYITAAIKYHRFASLHTYLNKITGGAVFLVPYILLLPIDVFLCGVVCVIGLAASIEELLIHLRSRDYDHSPRSLLFTKK